MTNVVEIPVIVMIHLCKICTCYSSVVTDTECIEKVRQLDFLP